MAVDPSVVINIATQFTGKKAFKQADTATQQLTKNVKNLAASFGVAFGTRAIIQFGKASLQAFVQDDKAVKALSITLKNLGLDYGTSVRDVNSFIDSLERQSGVADDLLRPALDNLLRSTGSVAKAQQLLGLSLDISAGTGKDLVSVSSSLSKAFLGNTASLGKLGIGLSKAQLTAADFETIQLRLNELFKGQAVSAADSYAGSLDKLTIAGNNAKEVIGKGIVQALTEANGGFANSAGEIAKYAQVISDLIIDIGRIARLLAAIPTPLDAVFNLGQAMRDYEIVYTQLEKQHKLEVLMQKGSSNYLDAAMNAYGAQKAADALAIRNAKTAAALSKAKAKSDADALKVKKDQAALDKAGLALLKGADVFDMDKISVQAALLAKGQELNKLGATGSETQRLQIANDLVRLTIKQDMFALEDAIAAKDVAGSTALAEKLNKDLMILGVLGGQNVKLLEINKILESFKPVDLINLQNLKDALALLAAITGTQVSAKTPSPKAPKTSYVPPSAATVLDILGQSSNVRMPSPQDRAAVLGQDDIYTPPNAAQRGGIFGTTPTPNITISAGVIASPDEFAAIVQKAVQNANRFGNNLDFAGAIR